MAHGQNVAHLVVKDFKEDEGASEEKQKMEVELVEEAKHNLGIVTMVLARVSSNCTCILGYSLHYK